MKRSPWGYGLILTTSLAMTVAQFAQAQSTISNSDVAKLKAFIGSNDFKSAAPSSSSSNAGPVVQGVYTVRPGDTLSEIMAVHLGDTGVNYDVMQKVIVKNNRSAFRRGNPHWLMAGAALRMPTVTDVMEYVVPGQKGKKMIASSDDWVRYP
jgi:Tfp pilus assembly protein FimV